MYTWGRFRGVSNHPERNYIVIVLNVMRQGLSSEYIKKGRKKTYLATSKKTNDEIQSQSIFIYNNDYIITDKIRSITILFLWLHRILL